jgi:hypothetical protein
MSKDCAVDMDPAEDAQKFIMISLGIGAMQHQVSAEKYQKKMTDGVMQIHQGGVAFLSNVMNIGGLGQGLFIVGNPPSQPAASFLHEKVKSVAFPSSKTCINLCGETIDLHSYGKSTLSIAAGKHITNNCLNGNVQSFDVNDSSGDESPQFVGVKTVQPLLL